MQRHTPPRDRATMMGTRTAACAIVASALGVASCTSPVEVRSTEEIRTSILRSAQRELEPAQQNPAPVAPATTADDLEFSEERLRELEQMAGPDAYPGAVTAYGPDLLGSTAPDTFTLSLKQAIALAVENNLQTQSARLTPAINAAQALAAQAAFDWVFFAGFDWSSTDQPGRVPIVNGFQVGGGASVQQQVSYQTGVRRALTTGGAISVSQGQTYLDDESNDTAFAPDPSNAAFIELGFEQPLLRGFGSDVALAEVRLARNAERDAIHELENTLIAVTQQAERAYWDLHLAYRTLEVRRRLLERGIETRDVLEARRDFDVRPSEFSDAVARVESRRADIIRAEDNLRRASDRLKQLINAANLPVGSETLLLPADQPVTDAISYSLLDSLSTALQRRPDIKRSLLSIDDASIRQTVAQNATLPLLDLTFQTRFNGLARGAGEAYEEILDADFVDLALGLDFEQPIGNRAAEADLRAAQLRRSQQTVAYRAAVQNAVLEVKNAMRGITTNYRLIGQTRVSRLAASENLRTLEVLEDTIQSLTPDFLDLKFSRQEALAAAELQEIAALRDYNVSLADYYAAMGTALDRNAIKMVVPDAGNFSDEIQ